MTLCLPDWKQTWFFSLHLFITGEAYLLIHYGLPWARGYTNDWWWSFLWSFFCFLMVFKLRGGLPHVCAIITRTSLEQNKNHFPQFGFIYDDGILPRMLRDHAGIEDSMSRACWSGTTSYTTIEKKTQGHNVTKVFVQIESLKCVKTRVYTTCCDNHCLES